MEAQISTEGEVQDLLPSLKKLIADIESGEGDKAQEGFDELTRIRESQLFSEMGAMTRQLHDALRSFEVDANLADVAETQIPDAKERLNYVITKTEEAAHRTLNAMDEAAPLVKSLGSTAVDMKARWLRLKRKEMDAGEFRFLLDGLLVYLDQVEGDCGQVNEYLTEVVMAQDFQDLTGQVVRRVIQLVQEVEENLVGMIRVRGGAQAAAATAASDKSLEAEGPQINSDGGADVVSDQDDVDDLLSSLGF